MTVLTISAVEERERFLEDLHRSKTGLADSPKLRGFGFVKSRDSGDGIMTFIASTEDVDRAGDVIKQDGWDLTDFRRNPVSLWGHDYSRPPIGRVPKIWVENRKLMNTIEFDSKDKFAVSVERKLRDGILTAQSVGFRPTEWEHAEDGGVIFLQQELLEISIVTVPMNQAAVRFRSIAADTTRGGLGSESDPFERLARRLKAHTTGRRVDRHSVASAKLTAFEAATIRSAIRRAFR